MKLQYTTITAGLRLVLRLEVASLETDPQKLN